MRTAAFSSFKKIYGRILLHENSKLAIRINQVLNDSAKNKKLIYSNETLKELETTSLNNENHSTKKFIRIPKGQYFVDIDYS